jgi:O-antigen/teichoic acid export membrane protein
MIGVVVSNGLAYIFHFVAGRLLGPKDYGELGALMAMFLLISLPSSSLGAAITKFTSRFYTDKEYGKIALLRKKGLHTALLFGALLLTLIFFLSKPIAAYLHISSTTPVNLIGITLVLALILPINRAMLSGMKKYYVLSWNNILESLTRLLLLLLLLYLGFGVSGAVMAYGLAYLLAFFIIFPFIKETVSANSLDEKIEIKPIFQFILTVFLVNLVVQSIINLPSIFIKHFYSSTFTGYWTAALNIARLSLFVTIAISTVMFPEISGEKDHHKKKKIFRRAALLVLLASTGMALVFFLLPGFFIHILYGYKYEGAIPILQWLGFAMILMGLLQLWTNYRLARLK